MKESDNLFDYKTSSEWNEMGNKFLRAGSYNDAINAFTRAIELAPDLSWPYIKNLASAHYHKGRTKGKLSSGKIDEPDIWEGEDDDMEPIVYFNQENIPAARRGDDNMAEVENRMPTSQAADTVATLVSPPQKKPSEAKPDSPIQTPEGTECGTSPAVDLPAGEKETDQQNRAMNAWGPATTPPGFKPIPVVDDTGPQSAYDWNVLGDSYASTQDYDKAINAYKNSIELDPTFGQAYCNLGAALFQSGKYESAALVLKKGLDYTLTPEEKSLTWNRLGDVYRRLRDYGNAMAAYQKAGQLNPDTNPVLTRARISFMDPVTVG